MDKSSEETFFNCKKWSTGTGEKYSIYLNTKTLQTKTTIRCYLICVRTAVNKTQVVRKAEEEVEKREHFSIICGNVNWYSYY